MKITAVDLYCGAGGLTSGLMQEAGKAGHEVNMLAINHWDIAIQTHSANHPGVTHKCMGVEAVDPCVAVPGRRVDLLVAGVSCTHHSNARGGKPSTEQQRADAWTVLRWCTELDVRHVIIENVREFLDWGPLYPEDHADEKLRGRPIAEKKGEYFQLFLKNLRALGYRVDHRILCAAHYGDATTRKRLFVQARKGRGKISWPAQTHVAPGELDLYAGAQSWRTAREIIDWDLPGTSIYGRKRPLSPNTMARIYAGLRKFSGLPFLVPNFTERDGQQPRTHGIDDPLPTVTSHGAGALIQPFLVILRNNCDALSVDGPVPTICADGNHIGIAQSYMIGLEHFSGEHGPRCYDVNHPMPTVTGKGQFALCEPFILKQYNTSKPYSSVDDPLPTVTASFEHLGLIEPYLVNLKGESIGRSIDEPTPTITAHASHLYLAEPYLIEYHGGRDSDRRVRALDTPIPTLDTSNRFALCEPFLVQFNGTSDAQSVEDPLGTVTTRDRFGLAAPELLEKGDRLAMLDIRFRMLQPHELAAAHSFPDDYAFFGNRDEQVKQIGNSVPVSLSAALCRQVLQQVSA